MGHKLNNKLDQSKVNKNTPRLETHQRQYEDKRHTAFSSYPITPLPWLDEETERYLRHALTLLIERSDDFQAAILYGSVARRTARPLDDPDPSDVDVLIIFAAEAGLDMVSMAQRSAVAWAVVDVIDQYPQARELEFMPTLTDLARWDSSFIENVSHDGILLWMRGRLPDAFQNLEKSQQQTPIS